MSLTKIVEKENVSSMVENRDYNATKEEGDNSMIYSPKLDKYVSLDSGKPKGEIQKYNVGMGPGTWY